MKLAEALVLRADIKKRIDQLESRIMRNAKVQEGQTPAEAPATLLAQMEALSDELVTLIQRINRTNSATEFEPGVTLADALATRDVLVMKNAIYRDLAEAATVTQELRTRSEIKFLSAVDVQQTQQHADQLARAHRELDTKIQELNWKTELK